MSHCYNFDPINPCFTSVSNDTFSNCEAAKLVKKHESSFNHLKLYYDINLWLSFIGGSITVGVALFALNKTW